MAAIDTMEDLAQDIYLIKNDATNDVSGDELTTFLSDTRRYINMWIDEFETETPWNIVRENDFNLGTITDISNRTIPITDATVRTLITSPYRPLTISQDGTVISTFLVVDPNNIGDPSNPETRDRATVIGRNIKLSRNLTEQELGGTVSCDIVKYFTKLSTDYSNIATVMAQVEPIILMKLGVAKNSTLPNVIQGQLSPSYVQKYNDELTKAKALNAATADSYDALCENLGGIGGVY